MSIVLSLYIISQIQIYYERMSNYWNLLRTYIYTTLPLKSTGSEVIVTLFLTKKICAAL